MRLISKYKNFVLLNKILISCPLKLLKFHRTKWKKTQKVLKYTLPNVFISKKFELKDSFFKKQKFQSPQKKLSSFTNLFLKKSRQKSLKKSKKQNFCNNLIVQVFFKRWFKLSRKYSEKLKLKRLTSQIFDNSIKNSFFKKELKKTQSKIFVKQFCKLFIKPLFKINILLTKLSFFSSLYETNQVLQTHKILLNGKPAHSNNFLKKGDLISFNFSSEIFFTKLVSIFKSSSFFSSFYNFVEVDHYSKTIIILKDYNSLSSEDINLIYKNYLNLKYFTDYFK
jgi:hypothetical protein